MVSDLLLVHILKAFSIALCNFQLVRKVLKQQSMMPIMLQISVLKALERIWSDEKFQSFFEVVQSEATEKCDPPVLPRKGRLPRRIDDGGDQHQFSTIEDLYRAQYFLKRHFQQADFLFIHDIESMLIDIANGKSFSIPTQLIWPGCVLWQGLTTALNATGCRSWSKGRQWRDQTSYEGADYLLCFECLSWQCCQRFMKIYYTVPVTTASAERCFSGFRRIKMA